MTDRLDEATTRMLGYLNFSSGTADASFRQDWNVLFEETAMAPLGFDSIGSLLQKRLAELHQSHPGFQNVDQAAAVVTLLFEHVWPAYRQHHRDLLFHLDDGTFLQPYFLAIIAEATLQEFRPSDSPMECASRVVSRLNDYIGHRPVAVLENGREMEPYPHEMFRPIPVYLKDAGVAFGPYQELIQGVLTFFEQTPTDILEKAHFHVDRMHEIAIDVRAYDHTHPVYKRTNYLFGEWDPRQIGIDGYYHRFIVRQIVLDALLAWLNNQDGQMPIEEAIFDANAALCGTILMASSICGSGPDTFDSTVSLTDLLPNVARQRDDFYHRLLDSVSGTRKKRLENYQQTTRQPFGHVRQYLNVYLARYGASQVQHRELSILFARMGYAEASQQQAIEIPSTSIRFESEVLCRLKSAAIFLDRNELQPTLDALIEIEDLVHRGIECGALIDPWNILGFAAQFQLFIAREDAIPDPRAEVLLEMMDQIFRTYSRMIREAAISGDPQLTQTASRRFQALAENWDKYATHIVDGLPQIRGTMRFEASQRVAAVLGEWAKQKTTGDLTFWKTNIDRLDDEAALEQVVESLLDSKDDVAAMGLLMQWLGKAEEEGLESSQDSINDSLLRWMHLAVTIAVEQASPEESFQRFRKLFESLEANAGTLWHVPQLDNFRSDGSQKPISLDDALQVPEPFDEDSEEDEDIFGLAYEGVTYRDTTDDGIDSSVDDTPAPGVEPTELEQLQRRLEPRLRFLQTVGQLWAFTAEFLLHHSQSTDDDSSDADLIETHQEIIDDWYAQTRRMQNNLLELLTTAWNFPIGKSSGDHDANVEFDIQHQVKFQILHTIVVTQVTIRMAEWSLAGCTSEETRVSDGFAADLKVVDLFAALLCQDSTTVQSLLPHFLKKAKRLQLLYVPFEYGGDPGQILAAQMLQGLLRFIVSKLPGLGLHRETWHVVQAAYEMERNSRPNGPAITEFDRLFRRAIRTSLTSILDSTAASADTPARNEELVIVLEEFVGWYDRLWGQHSDSMRLSAIENLAGDANRERVKEFISKYGAEFLHARNLTLGNVRAILQMGVENYLDLYVENQDPLHPSPFCEDIEQGRMEIEKAAMSLELVYNCVSDKFDRFLEYNSTTTHSDYGEKFYCLMEFLYVEAEYERMEWNLTPTCIAHELLVTHGWEDAALFWERTLRDQTEADAEIHLQKLAKLEQEYGFRLPSVHDHLNEQFVKPLAVNRMLSHVRQAMDDVESDDAGHQAFEHLLREIEGYRQNFFGSGIDVPDWLKSLDSEVARHEFRKSIPEDFSETIFPKVPRPDLMAQLRKQFAKWNEPLGGKPRRKRKRPESDHGGA